MNAPPPDQEPIPGDDLGLAVPDEPVFAEPPTDFGPPPVDGGPPPGYATEVVLVDDDDS